MSLKLKTERSSIGLSVDRHEFCAVQLIRDGDQTKVGAWAVFPRLETSARDTDGSGAQPDAKELDWAESILSRRGFVGKAISCTPPSELCTQHVFELPPANSGAPLEQLARVEVARERRCEPGDFEIGFWELPERGRTVETMAVACSKELVAGLIDTAEDVELQVVGIDLPELAVLRGVQEHLTKTDASGARPIHAVLHVGWDHSIAIVTLGDKLVYVRRIAHGASEAWEAVMNRYGMSTKSARAVIGDFELGACDERLEKIRSGCWKSVSKQLASELDVAFAYVSHSFRTAPLGRIVLSGYGANNKSLANHIDEVLGMPITLGVPSEMNDALPEDAAELLGPRFVHAYGLAARFDG